MTSIGVISDTHSYIDEKVVKHLSKCDQIWHAGDIGNEVVLLKLQDITEVKAVYGNIDNNKIRLMAPENNIFQVEKLKILVTHIGGYPGRYNTRCKDLISLNKPDIVVTGHSHILKIIYDKSLKHLHLNPGAAGMSGSHKLRTLIRFNINGKKIQDMEVVEMQR